MTDIAALRALTPGASQTRSKGPGNVGPIPPYPVRASIARGCEVVLEDGRRATDFICSLGAVAIGYGQQDINKTVESAVQAGMCLSLPSKIEEIAAIGISALGFETVRFVLTGSEAVTGALLCAYQHTRRNRIARLVGSYHGWHQPRYEAYMVQPGGDYDHVDWAMCSALLIETPRFEQVDVDWMRGLVAVARAHDCVIIFDEMVMGFRFTRKGGHTHFGVTPDIVCYGKALGNGAPIAAIAGRRDILSHAERAVSSTHGGNLIGLAAATAVMGFYEQHNVPKRIWELGLAFYEAFADTGVREQEVADLDGYACHQRVRLFPGRDPAILDAALGVCYDRGYLFHWACINFCYVMPEDVVQAAGVALGEALLHAAEVAAG